MSHTNLSASLNADANGQSGATNSDSIRLALGEMATGLKHSALRCGWKISDARRGRVANPFPTPEEVEEVIDAGGQFYYIARPFQTMVAHIRRRCRGKKSTDIKQAMMTAKRESDQAEVCAFRLALSMDCLGASDLSALSKEATEASLEWEHVKELAEDRLAEMQAR